MLHLGTVGKLKPEGYILCNRNLQFNILSTVDL